MRSLIKEWDNRIRSSKTLRYKTWTHRVRWYEGDNIRLEFTTPEGVTHEFHGVREFAEKAFQAFKEQHKIRPFDNPGTPKEVT